ncbi:MAG: rimO 2 [Phycisphaerales bacterium]|nr:rimO 2 [Phycisphaerales bacterium]
MPDIILTTLNAKYAHAAFGLRYLLANLGPLAARAEILEFDVAQRPVDVLEALLARDPLIVGVGVYIWNVDAATRLVADLKRVRPDVVVVLGGPEVSHETDGQEIVCRADYVVAGEADHAFADLCSRLLRGERPADKVVRAALPQFEVKPALGLPLVAAAAAAGAPKSLVASPPAGLRPIALPYDLYTDEDLRQRVVYVEASRGCPFKCEFCLSALDVPVRNVPLEPFLAAMGRLLDRGLRRFKFVDRTFNLNLAFSRAILDFFLARCEPGLFLHFEMIPDRLPDALRDAIAAFPAGALQFEVGVQSFDEATCARISRRQDAARVEANLRWLRAETGVHVHADLIVGLPGEDLATFGRGFDRLVALGPQEIQVGLLKRLRGTPIARHDVAHGMVYSPYAPYEVLATAAVPFADVQRMRRFARFWDLVANSGNFARTTPLLWGGGAGPVVSPFAAFLRFSDWLFGRVGRNHAIALPALAERLFEHLTAELGHAPAAVAPALWHDVRQGGRRDGPDFLRPHVPPDLLAHQRRTFPAAPAGPARQARHRAATRDG